MNFISSKMNNYSSDNKMLNIKKPNEIYNDYLKLQDTIQYKEFKEFYIEYILYRDHFFRLDKYLINLLYNCWDYLIYQKNYTTLINNFNEFYIKFKDYLNDYKSKTKYIDIKNNVYKNFKLICSQYYHYLSKNFQKQIKDMNIEIKRKYKKEKYNFYTDTNLNLTEINKMFNYDNSFNNEINQEENNSSDDDIVFKDLEIENLKINDQNKLRYENINNENEYNNNNNNFEKDIVKQIPSKIKQNILNNLEIYENENFDNQNNDSDTDDSNYSDDY